jgi:hypothetical protein
MERPPVEDWVDETGRVLLIGEAAHPILVGIVVSCPYATGVILHFS